ncbi:small ubiquitin-related modifier [Nematocida homosporus]|uniref:small ubiquitin-related modifier n=1 Tax=Nematocida homosporus TaxID=1912981 RepID=UPI00221F1E81|nr:small ubiquitin-related modifier [Nematocida homosporus]KAI5185481.1 small ubiquitin-related modifier [Nematocida homosporus]
MRIEELNEHPKKETTKEPTNTLVIRLRDESGAIWSYRLKKTTMLKKVFDEYTRRIGSQAKLRFSYNNRTLGESETPDQLEMADSDIIDVYSAQVGG